MTEHIHAEYCMFAYVMYSWHIGCNGLQLHISMRIWIWLVLVLVSLIRISLSVIILCYIFEIFHATPFRLKTTGPKSSLWFEMRLHKPCFLDHLMPRQITNSKPKTNPNFRKSQVQVCMINRIHFLIWLVLIS